MNFLVFIIIISKSSSESKKKSHRSATQSLSPKQAINDRSNEHEKEDGVDHIEIDEKYVPVSRVEQLKAQLEALRLQVDRLHTVHAQLEAEIRARSDLHHDSPPGGKQI